MILLTVFFIGLSVLLYPAVAQYRNRRVQSKAVADYEQTLESLSRTDYAAVFQAAYDYNARLYALAAPLTDYAQLSDYRETLDANGSGMIGYLSIEKLRVELPICHGTDAETLNSACGHLEGTSLPVGGESTHAVLSAHRGLPHAKLFTDLDRLQIGDTFTVTILDRVLTYEVDQIKTVLPNETSDIQIRAGKDECTLLTCTPYGVNTHRLLVRGHRIAGTGGKRRCITSEAFLVDRLIVTPLAALPILLALILYVLLKPAKRTQAPDDPFREEEGGQNE